MNRVMQLGAVMAIVGVLLVIISNANISAPGFGVAILGGLMFGIGKARADVSGT